MGVESRAEVKLAGVIGDGMVLQRDKPVAIWGSAKPGEHVKVEFAGQSKETVADASGSWSVKLSPLSVSATPQGMTITGENTIEVKDILVGEVWLASGQSNMDFAMGGMGGMGGPGGGPSGGPPTGPAAAGNVVPGGAPGAGPSGVPPSGQAGGPGGAAGSPPSMGGQGGPGGPGGSGTPVAMPETKIPERMTRDLANSSDPEIRVFHVSPNGGPGALQGPGKMSGWSAASPDSLKGFSAVAYYFTRKVHQETKVPIGMIQSSIGATAIEPWTPIEEYQNSAVFKDEYAAGKVQTDNQFPGTDYDAMIKPLIPFSLRGFLWYQGETNCDRNDKRYTEKMRLLIEGWRRAWSDNDLSFYYVQLAPFVHSTSPMGKPFGTNADTGPECWEQQTKALSIPNTGMAVITDAVEDVNNVHPPDKWDVGERLALIALAKDYGRKDVVFSGPMYKSMKIVGSEAHLSFDYLGGGLISHDGKPLTYFTIAGSDGKFYPADAKIIGDEVVVSSPKVAVPANVRFAWDEAAQPNFFNKVGLPAVPFRTGP